jgi:hypothetical protein
LSCSTGKKKNNNTAEPPHLTYLFDMVFNNPGETPTVTKYKDPAFLKEKGFNGMVPEWHIQCGLTYDSFEKGIIPEGSEERAWILKKQKWIKNKLAEAKKAGMPVYSFTDVLVLPNIILEKYSKEIVGSPKKKHGNSLIHGKLKPDINNPLTQKLLRIQIKELFETFPELDGLVIRFGETYLFDTPYHGGGNPVGPDRIEGHVKLLNILRDEVCVKRNKKLFYRTWDFGFFHTNPDIYLKITDRIEPHKNLFFSIKYTQGDFHRLMRFNPTLGIGKHPYIVEYQCQPEYYGKGAHADYVFDGMLNGFEEFSQIMKPGQKHGIKDLLDDPKFVGLWTWSRGGGWTGPYISNELWVDVNVFPAVEWAKNTTLTEKEALTMAAVKIGVQEESIDDFIKIVHLSPKGVVRGHCSLIDIPKAGFNVWWMRDQYMSDMTKLNNFFDYVIKNNKVEDVLNEKNESVEIWKQIEELSKKIKMNDPENEEYLKVSAAYGRFKYEIIEKAFTAVLLGYYGDKTGTYDKKRIKEAIEQYDRLWDEWKQFRDTHSSCATLYEPNAFQLTAEGASGNKKRGLGARINIYRKIVTN